MPTRSASVRRIGAGPAQRATCRRSGRSSFCPATISNISGSALAAMHRRHSVCADLAGLFADLQRLREPEAHFRQAHAGPRVRQRRRRLRARDRARSCPPDVEIVVVRNPPSGRKATLFSEARQQTGRRRRVDAAHAAVGPDTIAKFMFTSGSTGQPKGVINTQRMLVLQPGDDPLGARLFRGRAADRARLGAMASHRRRQSRRLPRALQRRHVLHRRRQAAAGRDRGHRAQPARPVADLVLQRAEGLRGAAAVSAEGREPAAVVLHRT